VKAEERLTALEAVLADAEAQVADLRAELAETRAEARLLREALDRDRDRGDRLEAALAETRKPVLVRLLEAVRRR
jgi:chromosome segregation ATPase